ncbi:MAG: histidine phosphatase family protein [Cellulosilyticaceae bacterium]
MTKFYMVRHGEPDWYANEKYKFKGHGRDLVPLTDKGIIQAKKAAEVLKLKGGELIIASPYTRTMQTGSIISRILDIEMKVEIDLREWQPDLTYEYETYYEFMVLCQEYEKYQGIYPKGKDKKWETKKMLKRRVDQVLEKYLDYSSIIVVCHEKVIGTQYDNKIAEFGEVIELIK